MPDGSVRQWDGAKWKAGGATATGPYLPLSGGAMSGAMTVAGNAAAALQPVPLQQLSSTLATTAPALNNVGRNVLHNGLFNVQQRGAATFSTGGVYTADRWKMDLSLDTFTVQPNVLGDSQRAQIGDEAAQNCLICQTTGNAGAASYSFISQPIENVYRLANKTVIVSFWAYSSNGLPRF